jgi:hypothetical protein
MLDPTSELGLLIQDTVYAGLDALRASIPLDLCAYLHVAHDSGPQLYLRSPELSSMDANEAFELFGALRDTLREAPNEETEVALGSYVAMALTTNGSRSRGLHVVGRRSAGLERSERDLATRLCRSLAGVCHNLEARAEPAVDATPIRVAVESGDNESKAEVSVPVSGGLRTGWGSGSSAVAAVATAVLDALGADWELVHAGDADAAGEHALLVLLSDSAGRPSLGCALAASDPLRAVAAATLDAANRLRALRV